MGRNFDDEPRSIDPAPDGRNDLSGQVLVYAHHSAIHSGANIEIDAPAGTQITVHLNDGLIFDEVIPR